MRRRFTATTRRLRAVAGRAGSLGWAERLVAVGLLCVIGSAVAAVTQVGGGTHAAAVVLPADMVARPYAAAGVHGPDDPGTASPSTASPAAASPSAPPPCPPPNPARRPGVPAKWPLVLVIPRIGVDAQVEQAVLDRHGHMQVPADQCDVAWYRPGAVPGGPGDAVIDGHLDWTTGDSVFWNLHLLHRGDEIDVLQNGGTRLRFSVSRVVLLPHATVQTGLFSTTGPSMLSLYTCAGVWQPWADTYSERLVVDAIPVR